MASEKKFIKKALNDFAVTNFLNRELEKAGVSSISITKTPLATRIAINVRRPGMVVGKKGAAIKELTEVLQKEYGIENPQIEVIEVMNPTLDARLVAEKIGRQIELRGNVKQVMRFTLNDVMNAGAIGVEIRIAGKVVGKGGKAKTLAVRAGYLKKSGEQVKKVDVGRYTAYLKAGAIGITVKLVPPGTIFSDQLSIPNLSEEQVQKMEPKQEGASTETAAEPTPKTTEAVIEEKIEKAKKEKAKTTKPRKAVAKKAPKAEEKPKEDAKATE